MIPQEAWCLHEERFARRIPYMAQSETETLNDLADNSFTPLCSVQTRVLNIFQTVEGAIPYQYLNCLHTTGFIRTRLQQCRYQHTNTTSGQEFWCVWSLWKLNRQWNQPPVVMTMELAYQHCVSGKNKCIAFFFLHKLITAKTLLVISP